MCDSRLNNSIALHNSPVACAEPWLIERVRHGADQTAGYASRHPRVRIQCDDIPDSRGSLRRASADRKKRSIHTAAEKLVQLNQLSSLAFPSHPFGLALVPDALSMQQLEARVAVGSGTMYFVQPGNPIHGERQQFVVGGDGLARRVHPVGEQRKAKITLGIS